MERREFSGAVEQTLLSSGISNVDTSIPLDDGSTFPLGSVNPFVIVIDRGLSAEEKILCSARSGNTITASVRGYDGTSASSHLTGAAVDHVLDAEAVQSMNDTTFDNSVLLWGGIGG